MNNATISKYDGRINFPVPMTRVQLLNIIEHPDSDGCTFTYDMLAVCKCPPPAVTKADHIFQIRQGELCAVATNDVTHMFESGDCKWKKFDERLGNVKSSS